MAPRDRWRTLLCALILLALPTVAFWRLWLPAPTERLSFHHGDFTNQHFPMRSFVAREYREGRLPLWSPYTLAGEPSVAESLYAAFYPLGLWEAVWEELPFLALELEALACLGLAGAFTFLFVREATGSRWGGLVAGVAFGMGGFLTSYPLLQMVILQVALWLPAGLWLQERALRRRSTWGLALAGAAYGVGALGGHYQTVLYAVYVGGAYHIFRCWQSRAPLRFTLAGAALMAAVSLGIGAPQWLPSLELAPVSTRGDLSYEDLATGFVPSEWACILRPNRGQWSPLYVGIVPLVLAVGALGLGRRRPETWFWAGVAALSLAASLGGNGPLYPLLYRFAPGFALFRGQERAAFPFSLAVAVLAGYGAASVARRVPAWTRGGARYLLAALLVGVTVVDLARANGFVLQALPEGGWAPPTPAASYLQAHAGPIARASTESLLPLDGNAALRYRYRDVIGNGPLRLGAYEAFIATVPEVRWWQMLNVGHVLTRREFDGPGFELVLDDRERDQRLYRLSLGQRAAWIAHRAELAPTQDEAIGQTASAALDPFETVILEAPPDLTLAPATGPEAVSVEAVWPGKVVATARLTAPGVVVLSEVAYPGWLATANGDSVESLRAYGVLRAVALPAGEWRLEWRYRPLTVYTGLLWALGTVAALALWAALLRRRGAAGRGSV